MSLATRKISSKTSSGLRNGPRKLNSGASTPVNRDTKPLGIQDDTCPVCKSDRYLNPNMKLLLSKCYHKMCESCIDRIFTLGPGPCPVCGQVLRKSEFSVQTFDDLNVEKEVKVRRELARKLNRRQEDFPNSRAYNDWLEFIENLAFNLINDIDTAETEAEILKYARENQDEIARNNVRNASEMAQLAFMEEREKEAKRKIREAYLAEEAREKAERKHEEARLIEELAYSGRDATDIIAKNKKAAALKRSSSRKLDTLNATLDAAMASWKFQGPNAYKDMEEDEEPEFEPLDELYEDAGGFTRLDSYEDPLTAHLHTSTKARAGGYLARDAYERALQDAFMGLLVEPKL